MNNPSVFECIYQAVLDFVIEASEFGNRISNLGSSYTEEVVHHEEEIVEESSFFTQWLPKVSKTKDESSCSTKGRTCDCHKKSHTPCNMGCHSTTQTSPSSSPTLPKQEVCTVIINNPPPPSPEPKSSTTGNVQCPLPPSARFSSADGNPCATNPAMSPNASASPSVSVIVQQPGPSFPFTNPAPPSQPLQLVFHVGSPTLPPQPLPPQPLPPQPLPPQPLPSQPFAQDPAAPLSPLLQPATVPTEKPCNVPGAMPCIYDLPKEPQATAQPEPSEDMIVRECRDEIPIVSGTKTCEDMLDPSKHPEELTPVEVTTEEPELEICSTCGELLDLDKRECVCGEEECYCDCKDPLLSFTTEVMPAFPDDSCIPLNMRDRPEVRLGLVELSGWMGDPEEDIYMGLPVRPCKHGKPSAVSEEFERFDCVIFDDECSTPMLYPSMKTRPVMRKCDKYPDGSWVGVCQEEGIGSCIPPIRIPGMKEEVEEPDEKPYYKERTKCSDPEYGKKESGKAGSSSLIASRRLCTKDAEDAKIKAKRAAKIQEAEAKEKKEGVKSTDSRKGYSDVIGVKEESSEEEKLAASKLLHDSEVTDEDSKATSTSQDLAEEDEELSESMETEASVSEEDLAGEHGLSEEGVPDKEKIKNEPFREDVREHSKLREGSIQKNASNPENTIAKENQNSDSSANINEKVISESDTLSQTSNVKSGKARKDFDVAYRHKSEQKSNTKKTTTVTAYPIYRIIVNVPVLWDKYHFPWWHYTGIKIRVERKRRLSRSRFSLVSNFRVNAEDEKQIGDHSNNSRLIPKIIEQSTLKSFFILGSCLDEVAAAANSNNISLNGGENNISGSKLQSTIASECPYEGCCSGTESIDSSAKSSVGAEPCKVVCCELYNPDYASLNGTCCCGAKLDPNESVIVNDALKSRSSALQDNLSSNNTNVTKRMPSAARPTEVLSSEAPIDMTHRFPSIDSSSNKKISSPPHSIDDSINMSSSNAMCTISDDTSALTAYKEHLEDLSGMEVHNAIPSSLRNAREELMQAALPKDVIKQVTDATKSVASTFQYTLIPTSHEMHSKAMNKTAEIPCAKIEPCLASSSAVEPPCARIEPCTKSATVESLKLVEPPCAAIAPCNIIPTSKPMEVTVKLEPRSIPSVAEHVKEKSLLTSKPTDVLGVKTEPSTTPSVAERVEVACVKMEPCMKPSIAEPVLNMPLLASKPTEVPCVKMDPCPTPQVVKEEPLSTPKPTEIPCVKMDPCPTPQVVKEEPLSTPKPTEIPCVKMDPTPQVVKEKPLSTPKLTEVPCVKMDPCPTPQVVKKEPLSTPKLTEVPCVKMDPCPMSSIAEPVKEMPLSKPAEVPCAKFDPCIAVAPPVEPSCVKMDACLNAPKMNEAGDSASNSSKSSLMANNSNHANCAKIDDRSKPPNNTESCVKIEACVAPPSNASAGCSSGGGNNHPNTMANSDPQATKPCCSQCKLACGTPCSSPAGSYSLPDQPVFSGSAYSGPAPPPPPKATCVSGPGHPYCGSPPSKQQGGCGPLPPAPPPSQQPPPHRPHHHRTCHKMANASQQAPVLTRSAVLGSLRSGCINFVRIGGISGFLAVAISAYAAHAFAKGGGGGGGEEKDEEQDEGGTRASSRQGTASRQSTGSPKSQEGDEGDEDDEGGNGKEYSDSDKQIFYTANLFHFVHSLALLATPVFKCPNLTGLLMTTGMVMFCGSCYLRVFTGNKDVTALTPYGGVLLLISWLTMVF